MRMSVGILSAIHGPADVHALDAAELPALCGEIRTTLVRYGHVHGGHIGSNLGMSRPLSPCTAYSTRLATASYSTCRIKATCIRC